MDLSEAKVYVGTYAKYNEGSIEGEWLDLSDYADKDEFLKACKELHKDECVCPKCGGVVKFFHDIDPDNEGYECIDMNCRWTGDFEDTNCEAEFMFQDYENIPEDFISESSIEEILWEFIERWNSCYLDEGVVDAFMGYESVDTDDIEGWFEKLESAYVGDSGEYSDDRIDEWYGRYCVDEGLMGDIPYNLKYYIDYEKIGRSCRSGGEVFYAGSYVFNSNY